MAKIIEGHNVNHIYPAARLYLQQHGAVDAKRRGGTVREAPNPVISVYYNSRQRVLFCPGRNANPFFHLMEAIWMFAGRNDVAFVSEFNARMKQYSDDGETLHGAYGYRWRHPADQIAEIVNKLRWDRNTRQATIVIAEPADFARESKDVPCNLVISFNVLNNALQMTVFCRSNDAIWGAYGSNVVHFSMLHELVALYSGLNVGRLYQISNNFHEYVAVASKHPIVSYTDPYGGDLTFMGLEEWSKQDIDNRCVELFLKECELFCEHDDAPPHEFRSLFLRHIACPMKTAWRLRKELPLALHAVSPMPPNNDWRRAATDWLTRRRTP